MHQLFTPQKLRFLLARYPILGLCARGQSNEAIIYAYDAAGNELRITVSSAHGLRYEETRKAEQSAHKGETR